MMNAPLYFTLAGATVLVLLTILRIRAMKRRFVAGDYFATEVSSAPVDPSYSCVALGPKIFDSLDSAFVAQETSPRFARRFRQERTGLALEWLRQIRHQTNHLISVHAKSARANPDLRVKDEVALGFDFLVFQLIIGFLYCAVWLRSLAHAWPPDPRRSRNCLCQSPQSHSRQDHQRFRPPGISSVLA
jgi:hypothetical protein